MKRSLTLVAALLALAVVSVPFVAGAADQPPTPPTTYYGTAAGASAGQGVIALVLNSAGAIVCGSGQVLTDQTEGIVYRVDVLPESSKAGCGAIGRQIQFYVVPSATAPGRTGLNLASWQPDGAAVRHNLQLGPPLSERRPLPESARDGLN